MPLEPELEAIFNQDPRFAEVLQNYERQGTSDPRGTGLAADAEHGGVTDQALQDYLDRFYTPRNPQFRAGQGGPPPVGGMEDQVTPPVPSGDGSEGGHTAPPAAPSPPAPSGTEGAGAPSAPAPVSAPTTEGQPATEPVTPAQPAAPSAPVDPFRPDQGLDPGRIAAWREFESQLKSDPRLQQILLHYSTTGRIPNELLEPPSSPYPQQRAAPAAPVDLTPPPDLDLSDPGVRALWDRVVSTEQTRQQQLEQFNSALAALNQKIDSSSSEFQSRVEAENEGLVQRVVSSFAHEHGLDPPEASRILRIAENLGVAAHYMSGVDPITMLPVRPDPMAAVTRALDIAYKQDPIAQEREKQRWEAAERARIQLDHERRRKMAGVGGGSGSAPRQPVEPTTREERTGAAVEWLRSFMNGQPEGQQ